MTDLRPSHITVEPDFSELGRVFPDSFRLVSRSDYGAPAGSQTFTREALDAWSREGTSIEFRPCALDQYRATFSRTSDGRPRVEVEFLPTARRSAYSRVRNINGSDYFMKEGADWTFLPSDHRSALRAVVLRAEWQGVKAEERAFRCRPADAAALDEENEARADEFFAEVGTPEFGRGAR